MPELPEVETVRRTISPFVTTRRVVAVEARRRDLRIRLAQDFESALVGRTIVAVTRRAKYLLFGLDNDRAWIVHLGMSGTLCRVAAGVVGGATAHEHVVISLDDGSRIVFRDPRRFGLMVVADLGACELLADLGPEPLDEDAFSGAYLSALRSRTKRPVKSVLMDQHIVAGLGNIYVNEILYVAGIRPTKRMHRLTRRNCEDLAAATRAVIGEAIEHRGTSMRDFLDGIGRKGGYQWRRLVYDREGERCGRCAGEIRSRVVGQRATYFCASCQT